MTRLLRARDSPFSASSSRLPRGFRSHFDYAAVHCTRDTVVFRRNTAWEICPFLTKLLAQDGIDKCNPSSRLLSFVSGNKLPAGAALDIVAPSFLAFRTTSALTLDRHAATTQVHLSLKVHLDKTKIDSYTLRFQ